MTTCPDCQDTGVVTAPATRLRYGRMQGQIVAVIQAGPITVHNQCWVCTHLMTRPANGETP